MIQSDLQISNLMYGLLDKNRPSDSQIYPECARGQMFVSHDFVAQ